MNPDLHHILTVIESSEHFSEEEKNNLIKSIKAADRDLTISEFKLERTEKVKRTTAILLEETIEELEQKRKSIEEANDAFNRSLKELKSAQGQLIQSEKMASLGELTAGIAHEIQNPLNFVNNFSEGSKELLSEMNGELENGNLDDVRDIAKDVIQNLEKITHQGKRADSIVKGMLEHSRTSTGAKEPTDINALADEYLRLAYHGLRAKNKSFNADIKTDFDESLGKINVIPQDIGRVLLNLFNNAFYVVAERGRSACAERSAALSSPKGRSAVNEKNNPTGKDLPGFGNLAGLENRGDSKILAGLEAFNPTISVTTKKVADKIEIRVSDNGNGIPKEIVDKIFQPFFTTKPTGQGTGLGLSLSYDIVKAHGGELKIESTGDEGTTFTCIFPLTTKR